MKRKLIVHIGYGKTGSSALQSWFANNQRQLSLQGVNYVGGNRDARNYKISSGNASMLLSYLEDGSAINDGDLVKYYFADQSVALVSGEALQTLGAFDKDDANILIQFAERNQIELQLVAYIRNIYNHNYSNYVQAIKRKGFTINFIEWFSEKGNIYPLNFYLGLYKLIPVDLVHYDQKSESLAESFCTLTNIDYSKLALMEGRRVNRTLAHSEIRILIKYIKVAESVGYEPGVFARCISDHLVNNYPDVKTGVFLSKHVVTDIEKKFRAEIDRFNAISNRKFGFEIDVLNESGYFDSDDYSDSDLIKAKSRIRSSIVRQLDTLSNGPLMKFCITLIASDPVFAVKLLIRNAWRYLK